jgi:quercetin dioxygenase-like cupin family protein
MFKIIKDASYRLETRNVVKIQKLTGDIYTTSTNTTKYFALLGTVATNKLKTESGLFVGALNETVTFKGAGYVIETPGFRTLTEKIATLDPTIHGDLSYIDGCSNTNVINPPRNGDPCLNYLYFPKGINQSFHAHPSLRVGFVLHGHGTAWIENDKHELNAGDVFILDRMVTHRFSTDDSPMSLIAFHPDSEDGPRDEGNPMKSRTYVK